MRLNNLKIRNFRCFDKYEIDFAPRVTVLFGKNGTGKTTLIHAIHKALSFMMYSDRVKTKNPKSGRMKVVESHSIIKGNPYLRVEGFSKVGDWHTVEDPLIEISAEASLPGILLEDLRLLLNWSISAYSDKLKLREGEFKETFRNFYGWYEHTGELPLLCYISDSFPHKEDIHHVRLKKKISNNRSFGYYNWNEELGNTKEWVGRLENTIREIDRIERRIRNIEEKGEKLEAFNVNMPDGIYRITPEEQIKAEKENLTILSDELVFIETILCNFASKLQINGASYLEVTSLGLHPEDDKLCLQLSNGEPKSFRNLPAGYKRLFSIVLDVAYRSFLLNPDRGVNSRGVVIIDEIDLHLHPELAKVALNAIVETFPQLQFIVSTHSAEVLAGVKTTDESNKILRMSIGDDKPYTISDVYGLDYNSVVQEIMNVGASNPELQRLINRCAYLYKNGYQEQADALRKQIIERNLINQATLYQRIKSAMRDLE